MFRPSMPEFLQHFERLRLCSPAQKNMPRRMLRQAAIHVSPFNGPLPEPSCRITYSLPVCTEVLAHALNWQQAFANANLLLRLGGAIVIMTPFSYPLHEEPYDYWRPTHLALVRMCETQHRQVQYLDRQNRPWDVMGTMLHSVGVAANQGHVASYVLARTVWRTLKFLALSAARSPSVRRILPLAGKVPMGTIVVAHKPMASAPSPEAGCRPPLQKPVR